MDVDRLTDQVLFNHSQTEQDAQDSAEQKLAEQKLDEQKLDEYLEDYQAPQRGDICTGVVIEVNERGLVVDVGLKREGFVLDQDLSRLDEKTRSSLQVGDEISVFVLRSADRNGHPILSIFQALLNEDWLKAEKMMERGDVYEGEISGYNRGGLIAQFGKIQGFIPASQIVGLPRRLSQEDRRQRLSDMVGQQIGLKIIEVDRRRRRLIFSQRRARRAWQKLQRERVMEQIEVGTTQHGEVTSITKFGAFVDLGGADGLIHVSELSWRRVNHPSEVLKIGDEVDVYVLSLDWERKRIALSLKMLQPDPWTLVNEHYREGQLAEGIVTRVLDFGAFVQLDLGVEGLLHVSEMIGTPELSPSDILHAGEKVLVKIINIDSQRERIGLSANRVQREEWERWVAEQQAAGDEEAAPEADVVADEVAGDEEAAPEADVVADEVAGEEEAAPEAEVVADEVAGEEEAAPEADVVADEVAGEEEAAPEAE